MHLVCGEALYDVFPDHESAGDLEAITFHAIGGGSPYNVAVGIARLEVAVALATDIARDGLGDRLVRRIAAEGICDRFVRRAAPNTPLAFVTVGADGAASYDFRGLGDALFAPELASVAAASTGISNLHLGSIPLVLPRSREMLRALAHGLCDEMLVSLDPNVRLAIEPDPSRWRDAIESVRPYSHVVKVSADDIALAYGQSVDPSHLCQGWLSEKTELVVLTLGSGGAKMFVRAMKPVIVNAVEVSVVDTVGAGDGFMAALLARLAQKGMSTPQAIAAVDSETLEHIGRYASVAAALTCGRRGPGLPHLGEVEALAACYSKAA